VAETDVLRKIRRMVAYRFVLLLRTSVRAQCSLAAFAGPCPNFITMIRFTFNRDRDGDSTTKMTLLRRELPPRGDVGRGSFRSSLPNVVPLAFSLAERRIVK